MSSDNVSLGVAIDAQIDSFVVFNLAENLPIRLKTLFIQSIFNNEYTYK